MENEVTKNKGRKSMLFILPKELRGGRRFCVFFLLLLRAGKVLCSFSLLVVEPVKITSSIWLVIIRQRAADSAC